jgi:hypothetical protein
MSNSKWISPLEILKEIEVIGSFVGYYDNLSGTLEWYDKDRDITIYATPNFVNDGEVPFDICEPNDGEYEHIFTIKMIDDIKGKQYLHYINVLLLVMNRFIEYPKISK